MGLESSGKTKRISGLLSRQLSLSSYHPFKEPYLPFPRERSGSVDSIRSFPSMVNRQIRLHPANVYGKQHTVAFDCLYMDTDEELERLLKQLSAQQLKRKQDNQKPAEVYLIQNPEELSKDYLRKRVDIDVDGKATSEKGSGKLYRHHLPVILVLDLRTMTPGEIASLNDLLDPDSPSLDKIPLGKHVELLVLVSRTQLEAGSGGEKPGPDLWRRLNRPGNSWDSEHFMAHLPDEMVDVVKPLLPTTLAGAEAKTIPLYSRDGWYKDLFGEIGIDDSHRIAWLPGHIERIQARKNVILKDCPENDPRFRQTFRNLWATGEFDCKGSPSLLPKGVHFYHSSTTDEAYLGLFENIRIHTRLPQGARLVIVNSRNLNHWLSRTGVNSSGDIKACSPLRKAMTEGACLVITSPLQRLEWICLLERLREIRSQSKKPLSVCIGSTAQGDDFPLQDVLAATSPLPLLLPKPIELRVVCNESWALGELLNTYPKAVTYRITPETTLAQLWDNLYIRSEKKWQYGIRKAGLQKTLAQGGEALLCGLESNPGLQLELETLFSPSPGLLVNGHWRSLSSGRLIILWPSEQLSQSVLWRSLLTCTVPMEPVWERWNEVLHSDDPEHQHLQNKLNQLYRAFETIPEKQRLAQLPEQTDGLRQMLKIAAREYFLQDRAERIEAGHWREAVDGIVTQVTRESPGVRGFLKVVSQHLWPDERGTRWIDRDRLKRLVGVEKRLDIDFVRQHFWPLMQCFGPGFFTPPPLELNYQRLNSVPILFDLLHTYLPKDVTLREPRELVSELRSVSPVTGGTERPSTVVSILKNALHAGWSFSSAKAGRIKQVYELAFHIQKVRDHQQFPEIEKKSRIEALLQEKLVLSKTVVGHESAEPLWSKLADDLIEGRINPGYKELRRKALLRSRIQCFSMVVIEGATGTGKSYFARQVARELGCVFSVTVGPGANENELLKRWDWQTVGDDRTMVEDERVILKWARSPANKDQYATLVIDEALAPEVLKGIFKGLWSKPPHIFCGTEPVMLSPWHRVVITVNPVSYSGRRPLELQAVRMNYLPLSDEFVREQVLVPALTRAFKARTCSVTGEMAGESVQETADTIMALYGQLKQVMPERVFTPRDLTDVSSWFHWRLCLASGELSQAQLNQLVWSAFDDSLGLEVPESLKARHQALKIGFEARYETADVDGADQWLGYYCRLFQWYVRVEKPDFDGSSPAVASLVRALIQDLDRCFQEVLSEKSHGGRRATIIEGPAGRGKDVTLKLLLDMWQKYASKRGLKSPDVCYLNAGDCSWDEIKSAIRKAQACGSILVISELNLISSADLEGELNDVLTEPAAPGFHLFATINPPGYGGRNRLSAALENRFRHLRIEDYTQAELSQIATQVLPGNSDRQVAATLSLLHHYVRSRLEARACPARPTCRDIQGVAAALGGEQEILPVFERYYRLYLDAAAVTRPDLESAIQEGVEGLSSGSPVSLDPDLCEWAMKVAPWLEQPVVVLRGMAGENMTPEGEIYLSKELGQEASRREVIRQLAVYEWVSKTGMPLLLEDKNDTGALTLYRRLQHHWFKEHFERSGISPDAVFQTSDTVWQGIDPVPKGYREYLDSLLDNKIPGSSLRLIWEKALSGPPPKQTGEVQKQKVVHRSTSLFHLSPVQLDCNTDYSNQPQGMKRNVEKTFHGPDKDSRMYRLKFYNTVITGEGLFRAPVVPADRDFVGVIAKPLVKGEPVVLKKNQVYGSHGITVKSGDIRYPLPSRYIREELVSLTSKPARNIQVSQDRYTGQYWVRFPGVKADEQIKVEYILERQPEGKRLIEARRNDPGRLPHCPEPIKQRVGELFTPAHLNSISQGRRAGLEAIKYARSIERKVQAIADFCRNFKGEAKPKPGADIGKFVLCEEQGACRFRAVAMDMMCRYSGIRCRIVDSENHSWCEVWNGSNWDTFDLGGGGYFDLQYTSDFPEIRYEQGQLSSYDSKKLQASDKEKLKQWLYSGSIDGFQKAAQFIVSLLDQSKRGYLIDYDGGEFIREKLCQAFNLLAQKPLESIKGSLFNLDQLRIAFNNDEWFTDMVERVLIQHLTSILKEANADPLWVSAIGGYMIEQGWLEPFRQQGVHLGDVINRTLTTLEILTGLETVPALRGFVLPRLNRWYQILFSRSLLPRKAPEGGMPDSSVHSGGCSRFFERGLGASGLIKRWTDQPQGMPDINRLIQGVPAFVREAPSGNSATIKNVVLICHDFYHDTAWNDDLIVSGFIEYLYRTINHKKINLHFIAIESGFGPIGVATGPSRGELIQFYLQDEYKNRKQYWSRYDGGVERVNGLEPSKIRKTINDPEALVIMPSDMKIIYAEYCTSLGL